ncbi:Zn-dependent oxidoreductase [Salicibibacter halophilus]|uniref:Zn-dependent oxidoreductase n=2 Tax=Salicibibacter halophilus TaxID=2502791 RepID=A0A514LMG6_9BACI|nr:Zn-dependent oxidoreductase [Salicibibacter halophilus]
MTAAVLTAFGGPDFLQLRDDVPVPDVQAGQVLVRVTAASVNNTDIWTREGAYGLPGDPDAKAGWRGSIEFPRIQGADMVGYICNVGNGVDAQRLGKRVLVDPAFYDEASDDANPIGLLGSERHGGFAEYVLVDDERAHDVSNSPLIDEQLACLPTAYGTALGMFERAAFGHGETVLITGASGGVGLALVQLAAARDATVIALTSSGKAEKVTEAGATYVVDRDSTDVEKNILEVAPRGLDIVADVVGGETVASVLPLLREGGRWVIAGAVGGPIVTFDLRRLYLQNRRFIGSSMHTPAHFRKLVVEANSGKISPRVAETFPLSKIHEAQRFFQQRKHVGKIVVLPSIGS